MHLLMRKKVIETSFLSGSLFDKVNISQNRTPYLCFSSKPGQQTLPTFCFLSLFLMLFEKMIFGKYCSFAAHIHDQHLEIRIKVCLFGWPAGRGLSQTTLRELLEYINNFFFPYAFISFILITVLCGSNKQEIYVKFQSLVFSNFSNLPFTWHLQQTARQVLCL